MRLGLGIDLPARGTPFPGYGPPGSAGGGGGGAGLDISTFTDRGISWEPVSGINSLTWKDDGTRLYFNESGEDRRGQSAVFASAYTPAGFAQVYETQFAETFNRVDKLDPTGVHFLYYGGLDKRIRHYTCLTAWDLSLISEQENNLLGVQTTFTLSKTVFSGGMMYGDSGNRLYYLVATNGILHEIDLSADPYNVLEVSDANILASVNLRTEVFALATGNFYGIDISTDGTKLLGYDSGSDYIYQGTLETPWDITTLVDDEIRLNIGPAASGFALSQDLKHIAMRVGTGVRVYSAPGWDA